MELTNRPPSTAAISDIWCITTATLAAITARIQPAAATAATTTSASTPLAASSSSTISTAALASAMLHPYSEPIIRRWITCSIPPLSSQTQSQSVSILRSLPAELARARNRTLRSTSSSFSSSSSSLPDFTTDTEEGADEPASLASGIPYADRLLEGSLGLVVLCALLTFAAPLFSTCQEWNWSNLPNCAVSLFFFIAITVYVAAWLGSAYTDLKWYLDKSSHLSSLDNLPPPQPLTILTTTHAEKTVTEIDQPDSAWEDGASPSLRKRKSPPSPLSPHLDNVWREVDAGCGLEMKSFLHVPVAGRATFVGVSGVKGGWDETEDERVRRLGVVMA
ncbi:hypothetical protein HDU67_006041 [Dinochytrium kinnereticum]|nr:hypothetical protein HDU67_006041 [Dinochytrium kinnereticum]